MTKKHFQAIADWLVQQRPLVDATPDGSGLREWRRMCREMADMLANISGNPLFDRDRFLSACGVGD